MKTLFWKEWRENFKWAAIAAACVLGAMFYSLRPDRYINSNYIENVWQSLCSPQVLLITSFGFPIIAAALGFLQILTELRRDQWAFLVHRPISRHQIFWGKASVGLVLYLLATVVPFLMVSWWVSRPGSIPAPFDWRLSEAGLLDALAGIAFYFAALWSGIQPGRWYGPRALPLVAAYFTATAAKEYYFLPIFVGTSLTVLAVFLASWASFLTFGSFRKEAWWGKSAVALSYLLAILVVQSWLGAGWRVVFPEKAYTYTQYEVTKDGQLVRVQMTNGGGFLKVNTLDGREIAPPRGRASFQWQDFLNAAYLYLRPESFYPSPVRSAEGYFTKIYDYSDGTKVWYYDQNYQLSAYSLSTKRLIGVLGPKGFVPAEGNAASVGNFAPARYRFEGMNTLLVTPSAIYEPRLGENVIRVVYQAPAGEKIISAGYVSERNISPDRPRDYLIATEAKITASAADGQVLWSYQQPANFRNLNSVEIFRSEDHSRYFLLYGANGYEPTQYVQLSARGDILKQDVLPREPYQRSFKITPMLLASTALAPFGQTLWNQAIAPLTLILTYHQKYTPIWKCKADYQTYTYVLWGMSLVWGVLCALAARPLMRRLNLRANERRGWTIFLIFYSVVGLLVFLIAHRWPRHMECAACQQKRSVERPTCEHCGASWPEPARDGTEIFEAEPTLPTTT